MKIIIFTHPSFLPSQSMPRYAKWISEGMKKRGHSVDIWSPSAKFYKLPVPVRFKKWMGYIDQYIVFPRSVCERLKQTGPDTLFVFADHALGPWVPLVADRPHVVHCHDFLAQRSALGEIPENISGFTGKSYQAFIRNGYKKGKFFISVSKKTRDDLDKFLDKKPILSEVVYNGLTNQFSATSDINLLRNELSRETSLALEQGYILHVGGNQWYKNRSGVIKIYEAWRKTTTRSLPLLMVGANPSAKLKAVYDASDYQKDIHLLTGKDDDFVKKVYSAASVLLFPSLDEGFGWPLIEGMAAGCPVITTNAAPMNEVGADAAIYIARAPLEETSRNEWAKISAETLDHVLSGGTELRQKLINQGIKNLQRFKSEDALDKIEKIYKKVLAQF